MSKSTRSLYTRHPGVAHAAATRATTRLVETGGLAKGDRITHRMGISALSEIDDEVKRRLRNAYDRDA